MGRSFRPIDTRFPYRAETWEQKPTDLGNILTISNLKGGNIGIGEPSLSSSQPLSISPFGRLWVEVSNLLCFYTFSTLLLLAFLILSSQSTISLLFIIHLEFWAWFSIINSSKEPKGRCGPFTHFWPSSQNVPNILATPLGSQATNTREMVPLKVWNQQRDGVSHTNLSFQGKPYIALPRKKSIVKLSLKMFYP